MTPLTLGAFMKIKTEVEIVWEIWHLIARLNDLIWDLYENEFLYILEQNGYTAEDLNKDIFPF
jgi:hypothetical protein